MELKYRGFIVHCYADIRKNQLYLIGRLDDGRSFAAAIKKWQPSLHINEKEKALAEVLLSSIKYETAPAELKAFDTPEKLISLKFFHYRDYTAAGRLLENNGIYSPDGDLKPPDAFCISNGIKGPVEITGQARQGRLVDLVFPDPIISPLDLKSGEGKVELKIASIDVEIDVNEGTILAASMCVNPGGYACVRVLGTHTGPIAMPKDIYFHSNEASLLEALLSDIRKADPDVLTGWNFLDFDFPRLAERCIFNKIPFRLGRSEEDSKYFPPSMDDLGRGEGNRRRSAAAIVQGRQVLDALRIFRSSPRAAGAGRWDSSSYSLQAVARSVLGEGKLLSSVGAGKIAELKELYSKDPVRFGEYCLKDAQLVLDILEETGLFRLTRERASLTGVSLDKAWTNVVSFERIYAMELHRIGIAPKALDPKRNVSGASGGTVLEPLTGLFPNVAVFDFRSLYPTIILTFNIDPLANARAGENPIIAPNGAAFSREKGILPGLIAGYFAARQRAIDAGDEEASFVYKILMNSFYGVMGTPACRYGRSELAGAITSFAKKWLHFSRDWFSQNGYKVLYGDTDSLFVESGLGDGNNYKDFLTWGENSSKQLNASIKEKVREEYGQESFMEMRFEKIYRRFMIPPLRAVGGEGRGRAKGYGGYLLNPQGDLTVEVKGMEAVRSDYTPLARRIQLELLELVFVQNNEELFKKRVYEILHDMRLGSFDSELVYRKRLARVPESYTASTPPQVKAARALGWKNRRGTVEFVWTINGPEPCTDENRQPLPHAPLDYDHYAESQLLPTARSIAAAAGWKADFPSPGQDYFRDGQMELDL